MPARGAEDKYPLLLINGGKLAAVLETACLKEGLALIDLLERECAWYDSHIEPFAAHRILDDSHLMSGFAKTTA